MVAAESVETAAKDVESQVTDMAASAETKVSDATKEATETGSALLTGLAGKAQSVTDTQTTAQTSASDVVATAKASVTPPETVVIENNYGNVTLPHAFHGKTYGCPTCHGDNTPGPFELGKATAHVLCKDCHKAEGAPTNCGGCHKK
mgnify:CR=1 FL=1